MNKQKAISLLQSRIAKRRSSINGCWVYISTLCNMDYPETYYKTKKYVIALGYEQKVDKALLKMLQSPFDAGYAVGYQDACKAVKLTLEACEC